MPRPSDKKPAMTRRALLGTGAIAGLGLAAGSSAAAGPMPVPKSWDEDADVVVIGTGFAGFCVAYEPAKTGASVALLEQMRSPDGNSIINGGLLAAAGTPDQGVEGSAESLLSDKTKAGLNLNHPHLERVVAERSAETAQWTIDEIGVECSGMMQLGGRSVPHSLALAAGSGSGIVVPLLGKLEEMGVKPKTRTMLRNLFRDEDGRVRRVQGVLVHERSDAKDPESGAPKTIRARLPTVSVLAASQVRAQSRLEASSH
ncbi:FAD-dependent oxidoreductase [Pelagimonas varians]|uniref:Fumarate reductase flavoprotein subunit n=1 Tax=Pelagimonas varians TaxID=696760 RepID=A0A238JUH5_9RHOB|nr:FAD-dependent oxidoreductase [Pelagimonas varians]PYG34357.1 FAD binding domain-containing protein [Pelagimonas varians]SMX34309.1 Fumarate reductase flavoprotein subunit precursor [Pelagimonas varians]